MTIPLPLRLNILKSPKEGFILIRGLGSGEYSFREIYTRPWYKLLPDDGCRITIEQTAGESYTSAGTVYLTDCAEIAVV